MSPKEQKKPQCPFPLRMVDQVSEDGAVFRAKRTVGTVVHRSHLKVDNGTTSWEGIDGAPQAVADTARIIEVGLCASEQIAVDVAFVENHSLLFDIAYSDSSPELWIDLSMVSHQLSDSGSMELLARLALPSFMQVMVGQDTGLAMDGLIDRYRGLTGSERQQLDGLLGSDAIDSGNLSKTFLARAVDDFAENDRNQVERWITWLYGQTRIDLPYDRQAVNEVLSDDTLDPDEARLIYYQIVRSYDREIESDNITRVASQVRDAGQELLFGRMSRAFHNQALLFAHSSVVTPTDEMRQAGERVTGPAQQIEQLAPYADGVTLLTGEGRPVSLIRLAGAIEHLEDAIVDYQSKALSDTLSEERLAVEDHSSNQSLADRAANKKNELLETVSKLLEGCRSLRHALLEAPRQAAAYVVISQRPSPTGSHLLAKINEFAEPYLGKADNLKKLVGQAGHQVYASPDYGWLEEADHWVEAIPLFIKEQVRVVDGEETSETVIDQAGMEESFREQMADHWAANIDHVTAADHLAIARDVLVRLSSSKVEIEEGINRFGNLDEAVRVLARDHLIPDGTISEGDIRTLAQAISVSYRQSAAATHRLAETDGLSRREALASILFNSSPNGTTLIGIARLASGSDLISEVRSALADQPTEVRNWFEAAFDDLPDDLFPKTRSLPSLHVLTTQSARMTDGYIRRWIEESMALRNVVRDRGLEPQVRKRMAEFERRIGDLGEQLLKELGMWVEIEEVMAIQRLSQKQAVERVIWASRTIQHELSLLAILQEIERHYDGDPPAVDAILQKEAQQFSDAARDRVIERNGDEIRLDIADEKLRDPSLTEDEAAENVIATSLEYRTDYESFVRLAARDRLLGERHREQPEQNWPERVNRWLRDHQRLAKTTARKAVISEAGLNHLTLDPFYYYQAIGANKRYHLLYTPSRVDLGERERESVESWAQWVGGLDEAAAQEGQRVYGLINKSVKRFDSLIEPEILKTGENASMAAHLAYSNAMALMVNTSGRGDMEELGDQMGLRKDRLIHASGEGYGGYCVPKDGLFLEFVLTLTRATKLRQLGVDDRWHKSVAELADRVLTERESFDAEIEWESWASQLLADNSAVREYFDLRRSDGRDEPVPVFQITKLAQAIDGLGRPELRNPDQVTAALAARFGLHTMIAGAEHVNRFMVFYKVWLIHQTLSQARIAEPQVPLLEESTIVLEAEYKPDTQDGRFAVGMRKYDIFSGTGAHLAYSLGTDGQDLVALMFEGWDRATADHPARRQRFLKQLDSPDSSETDNQLSRLMPAISTPREVRLVSVMGLSTGDVLHYTGDTKIEQAFEEAKSRLYAFGLSDEDIETNLKVYGSDLRRWAKLKHLSADPEQNERLEALLDDVGPHRHTLALGVLGPDPSLEHALQGADVFDTGIPHREVLALLDDPGRLRDLMLEGHPNSALAIVDGASGARRRAMNRLGVMRWFAVCEQVGRQGAYASIGLGAETVEAWRTRMRREKGRAERLFEAASAGDSGMIQSVYDKILASIRDSGETSLLLEDEARLMRFKRDGDQDHLIARLQAEAASDGSLATLDFAVWLALGGLLLLDGAPESECIETRRRFEESLAKIEDYSPIRTAAEIDDLATVLVTPKRVHEPIAFSQERTVEGSNKATEEVVSIAMDTRRELAQRARIALIVREREKAFESLRADLSSKTDLTAEDRVEQAVKAAKQGLGDWGAITAAAHGQLLAALQAAVFAAAEMVYYNGPDEVVAQEMRDRWSIGVTGRGFDLEGVEWREMRGGYEDIGDIGRLAQRVAESRTDGSIVSSDADRLRDRVADIAELFDTALVLELTAEFAIQSPEDVDAQAVWRAVADAFAETLNDHFYEYRPWLYCRGIGFDDIEDQELYDLAKSHHEWLYAYVRNLVVTRTEMRELRETEQQHLLGDVDGEAMHVPIGARTKEGSEQWWRCYNHLREIAFLRNDGFSLPCVFEEFDPALIDANNRTNILVLYPVGRTHASRLLMEGPTLSRELAAQGHNEANIIITRYAEVASTKNGGTDVLHVHDGHFYVTEEICAAGLERYLGMSAIKAAQEAAKLVGSKGVRIAARFASPVTAAIVLPLHNHPLYDDGDLEGLGLPYSTQSRFHTWTTYDKTKYTDIFGADAGVDIPDEIDWMNQWTSLLSEPESKRLIESGDPAEEYEGIRSFASRHPIIMIKDASESGGRNQKPFVLVDGDGNLDDASIADATDFVFQVSRSHNVAIQEVLVASPEAWATEEFMERFTDRQIVEWGLLIERCRRPHTPLYGSHRLIVSTDNPNPDDGKVEWHISHPIALCSTQLITNVGRGGTLDLFQPKDIRVDQRDKLLQALDVAAKNTMQAMADYEHRVLDHYRDETGNEIGRDLNGVSYGFPRYLMLDFLVTPVFDNLGTLVDLTPQYDETGSRIGTEFVLVKDGHRTSGTIVDWRVTLIEPNIGVGLWDRVALREAAYEKDLAAEQNRAVNPDNTGENARIVLKDLALAGEAYLSALHPE